MSVQISTHASLLARLSEGADGPAWNEFHSRYRELIRGFAARRGLQTADAEDVVQEVFLALAQAMRSFEYQPEKGRFRGFLKTIAIRVIGKRFTRGRAGLDQTAAEHTLEAAADESAHESDWEVEWRQHHLRTAMERVRAEFRGTDLRAFQLLTSGPRDARSVAAELGISVDSAYQAKSRILKRLRELVAEQVEAEG
ncbi:MAG: sigma-70 family RNA polymerase sigma factor [Planctomycetes bacterium]|nr:sigma-70 family RNA polymerase sigma factor [Planctomycetota bacterium]